MILSTATEPIHFAIKQYAKIPYQPLDKTIPLELSPETSVYHVTKEFGPATMGGMGTVLTAMAQAQLKTKKIKPSIVLPHYSFLNKQEQYPIKKTVDLSTTVRDKKGKLVNINFRVSQFKYDFQPNENFSSLTLQEKQEYASLIHKRPSVMVYLIGFGKREPFFKAFRAQTITDIYSSPDGLPQEWKDQYFAKAASTFLIWRATGKYELSLFAPLHTDLRIDVVHLHGATNAYIAKYLDEFDEQMGPSSPSIVYTMHDYLDELQYTNTISNVKKFLNSKREASTLLKPFTFKSNRVFMSPMAIELADAVTFVSESMATDMIEGRHEFYLKEVVMQQLLKKAKNQQFYGISNGIDLQQGSINPFTDKQLIKVGLNYSMQSNQLVDMKRGAKQYLIQQGLLQEIDLDRPLVLYVGRFQYNKGLETFEEAAKLFQENDMKFVIIGQPNNYPLSWVKRLASKYPKQIVLMTTEQEQHAWLIYFRAAADFVYVPSVTESFGLVAAEGLLFGSSIISTGVGGLREFLVDRKQNQQEYNAYLFHDTISLSTAIRDANQDFILFKQSPYLHEKHVLDMIKYAFELGWERSGQDQGPVYDYIRIYQKVMNEKRHLSKFRFL